MSAANDYNSDHNSSGASSVIAGQPIYQGGSMHHNLSMNSSLHHTMPHRQGSCSPPLPPPPSIDDEHARFGQPGNQPHIPIVPNEMDLPGWVPKNYIEKGIY